MSDKKLELLQKCTLAQLKQIAGEKKITIRPGFWSGVIKKQNYVDQLYDSRKISVAYLRTILEGEASLRKWGIRRKKIPLITVARAIEKDFYPHHRYNKESEYERDFENWCRGRFGSENIATQYSVGKTRVDVVVGNLGIELKFPKTARSLMTLRGQIDVYQKHFGKNSLVLLFSGKCDHRAIAEFKEDMRKKKVKVIEKR